MPMPRNFLYLVLISFKSVPTPRQKSTLLQGESSVL